MFAFGVAGLLAPASLMAADAAAPPPATDAATTAVAPATAEAPAAAAPKEGVKEAEKADQKAKPKSTTYCSPATGSLLRKPAKNGCTASAQPLRTYSQDDLQRTGEIKISQALRKLDTSIY